MTCCAAYVHPRGVLNPATVPCVPSYDTRRAFRRPVFSCLDTAHTSALFLVTVVARQLVLVRTACASPGKAIKKKTTNESGRDVKQVQKQTPAPSGKPYCIATASRHKE